MDDSLSFLSMYMFRYVDFSGCLSLHQSLTCLLSGICDGMPFDLCDAFSQALVQMAAHHGWLYRLFSMAGYVEVNRVTTMNTIFREDSMCTKMTYQVSLWT